MKKESTKLVKKKLELNKSTVAKFVMNDGQLKAIMGGVNTVDDGGNQSGDALCTLVGIPN